MEMGIGLDMVPNIMLDRAECETKANNLRKLHQNLMVLHRNLRKEIRRQGGRHQWQTYNTIHRNKEMTS